MKTTFLIAILAFSGFAQVSQETKMLKLPKYKTFFTEYDKFKDITTVRSPNFTVNQLGTTKTKLGSGVMLVLQYTGPDIAAAKEKQFRLLISHASAGGMRRVGDIIALIDGQRVNLNVTGQQSDVKRSGGLGIIFGSPVYVDDKLVVPLSPDTVARLKAAQTVEMQVGSEEFTLHTPSIEIFKNIFALDTTVR